MVDIIKWPRVWKKERKSEKKIWNYTLVKKITHGATHHPTPIAESQTKCIDTICSIYLSEDILQKNMHADRHFKKSKSVRRMMFDYPLHPHTACTHSYTQSLIVMSSDITISHFKDFSSEHSCVWYLKHPPKVLRVLSSHTHTLYTLTHTDTHTHSLAPQQKCTDWSQWRAIERKSEKL